MTTAAETAISLYYGGTEGNWDDEEIKRGHTSKAKDASAISPPLPGPC